MAIIESRKDGHVLTFSEEEHVYTLDGEIVPGATDVKKAYPPSYQLIKYWIKQGIEEFESGRKLKDAADVGTLMHDYCWALRTGNTFDQGRVAGHKDEEKIRRRMAQVERWVAKREQEEKVVEAEKIVCSIKHRFAGKFDALVLRDSKLRLQDYKSAKGFYVDQFLQGGGYAQAIKEWLGLEVEEIEIIRFNDNTEEPESHVVTNVDDFRKQFISCRKTRAFQAKWEKYFDRLYRKANPWVKKAK